MEKECLYLDLEMWLLMLLKKLRLMGLKCLAFRILVGIFMIQMVLILKFLNKSKKWKGHEFLNTQKECLVLSILKGVKGFGVFHVIRSEEHTSELQSRPHL